jgi:CheY-like chemotaxis protein
VPTIVVTADDAPEARARCLAAGASEFLRKPIGAEELLAALRQVVHRE